MRALSCSHHSPPLTSLSTTIPNPKSPNLQTLIPNNKTRSKWKLKASGKGFQPSRNTEKPGRVKPKLEPDPEDDPPIPQEVFDKMLVRILVSVGTPLGLGLGILKLLEVLKDRNVIEVPLWVPFITTLATFGASALGIAYGSLSTNLDPNKTGSLLGLDEVQENWVDMWKQDSK